jgi:hypothetical protein
MKPNQQRRSNPLEAVEEAAAADGRTPLEYTNGDEGR